MYARNYLESAKLVFLEWVEDMSSSGNFNILTKFNAVNLLTIFLDQKFYVSLGKVRGERLIL